MNDDDDFTLSKFETKTLCQCVDMFKIEITFCTCVFDTIAQCVYIYECNFDDDYEISFNVYKYNYENDEYIMYEYVDNECNFNKYSIENAFALNTFDKFIIEML